MNAFIIFFCFFCAVCANPITVNIDLDPSAPDTNLTEPLLITQLSGNDTSESQSSQSQSSESVESASSDSTSEESDSVESNENTEMLVETRDDSMGSEENIRKSWVRVFATVVRDASTEDNSTEVKDQQILNKLAAQQPMITPTVKTLKQSNNPIVSLLQKAQAASTSSSESAESTDNTALIMAATADSSQSVSSESNETSSSSEASDSMQSSESDEDSNVSDSAELNQIINCVNGTQSCESEEYVFQDIGDDANYSVDNLMVLDKDDRELSLRR
ncbi:hypothetical protein NQD34_000846 [Periophthalmus magnuspinnatus]|nr:secretory calcium-binding phosphoprotein 1 [Periophthalmus magnuspinnatus]KAJ0033739.1 hypothetical protein NQD34_000846 [Periophthalmus magnuspinnatus]